MRLYVIGPMRGLPLFNFPAFDNACLVLRGPKEGDLNKHLVHSPAEHDREIGFDPTIAKDPEPEQLAAMMRWDLERVLECDAVVLLPGWQRSMGGLTELLVAVRTGKKVYEFDPAVEGGMREIPAPILNVTTIRPRATSPWGAEDGDGDVFV